MLPMWVLVGEERKKKSNRSFWDAFELLLIKSICINKSGLSFRYQQDLDEVIKKAKESDMYKERMKQQKDNIKACLDTFLSFIKDKELLHEDLVNILWTWREKLDDSTADINLVFKDEYVLWISLKSTASSSSSWTMKNIWMNKIKEYYNVDIQSLYTKMIEEVSEKTWFTKEDGNLKEYVIVSSDRIIEAKEIGNNYLKQINEEAIKSFNGFSLEEKIDFISLISHSNNDNLYVLSVQNGDVHLFKSEKILEEDTIKDISISSNTDTGFSISVNWKTMFRIQTSCTNWVWISAFCQRCFMVK